VLERNAAYIEHEKHQSARRAQLVTLIYIKKSKGNTTFAPPNSVWGIKMQRRRNKWSEQNSDKNESFGNLKLEGSPIHGLQIGQSTTAPPATRAMESKTEYDDRSTNGYSHSPPSDSSPTPPAPGNLDPATTALEDWKNHILLTSQLSVPIVKS
jgi:hypothetical protein